MPGTGSQRTKRFKGYQPRKAAEQGIPESKRFTIIPDGFGSGYKFTQGFTIKTLFTDRIIKQVIKVTDNKYKQVIIGASFFLVGYFLSKSGR